MPEKQKFDIADYDGRKLPKSKLKADRFGGYSYNNKRIGIDEILPHKFSANKFIAAHLNAITCGSGIAVFAAVTYLGYAFPVQMGYGAVGGIVGGSVGILSSKAFVKQPEDSGQFLTVGFALGFISGLALGGYIENQKKKEEFNYQGAQIYQIKEDPAINFKNSIGKAVANGTALPVNIHALVKSEKYMSVC